MLPSELFLWLGTQLDAPRWYFAIAGFIFGFKLNEDNLRFNVSGMSDMENGGTITFEPLAFRSREELARTIFHEKLHIDQYRKFGYNYVTDNVDYFERITREAEEQFAAQMKKEGRL